MGQRVHVLRVALEDRLIRGDRLAVPSLEETRARGPEHALEHLGRDGSPGPGGTTAARRGNRRRERRGPDPRRGGGPVGLGVANDASADRDPEKDEQDGAGRERGRMAPGGARFRDARRWAGRRRRRGAEAVELCEDHRGTSTLTIARPTATATSGAAQTRRLNPLRRGERRIHSP